MGFEVGCLVACTLLSGGQRSSGVYDFYLPGVKRGSASFEFQGGNLLLKSSPGFAANSSAELDFADGKLSSASYSPVSGAGIEFTVSLDGVVSVKGTAIAAAPLYTPVHPMLLKFLLDRYDFKKAGFQPEPAVNITTGAIRPTQVELYRTQLRSFNGHAETLREWRFVSPPTAEAVVWTDLSDTPLYWWVPSVNYEAVLRGCDDLRPSKRFEGRVSPPRFEAKVEKDVWIPMRDGVRLQADVYQPNAGSRFPVILQRSPYDRSEFGDADGEFYAQRGYVYVTEHVRGRGSSEGDFVPTLNEAADGYDTVAWCGTQPWSDGRVGMIGASYNGFCCWMAAKTQPKWLKTMVSVVPMPGPPTGAFWDRGTSYPTTTLSWFGLLRDRHKVREYTADVTKAMNTLPLSKLPIVQFGQNPPGVDFGLTSNTFDAALRKSSYRFDMKKINLPVLYLDGWLDPIAPATKMNYKAMVRNGRKNQKLIFGPWDHFTNRESQSGLTDWGPDGYFDMRTTCLRWFDRFLKGMPNGIDKEPSVSEFLYNEGWRTDGQWPPRGAAIKRWYLGLGGSLSANPLGRLRYFSQGKQRSLMRLETSHGNALGSYVYDPAKYVYSPSFTANYFGQIGDQANFLCRRKDQVLFDSAPLSKALTLDGPILGRLYASSSAKDTDWVMALIDRHPNGDCVPLAAGFIRARYRRSITHPTLLTPGKVVRYDIDLQEAGIKIPAGHTLRVVVCSSLYPDTDRNLNTGEPIFNATKMVVARQKVYPGSYVELPVLKDG